MITKLNVTQQVINYIKENIKDDTWKIGDRIPSENKLAEILGVSRASIRVAIQQFIAIGAMESFHGKGTFITSNNLDVFEYNVKKIKHYDYFDMSKILEFRLIIEVESVVLAVKNATEENIINMRFYIEQMKTNVGNSEIFVKYDMLFHEEIAKATGNHIIEGSLKDIFVQKEQNHKELNEIFGYKDGIYYHTVILEALINRNAKKAKILMREHLQKALDEFQSKEN